MSQDPILQSFNVKVPIGNLLANNHAGDILQYNGITWVSGSANSQPGIFFNIQTSDPPGTVTDSTIGYLYHNETTHKLFWVTEDGMQDLTVSAGGNAFADNAFRIYNSVDNTKRVSFDCQYIDTATTRSYKIPNTDGLFTSYSTTTSNMFTSIIVGGSNPPLNASSGGNYNTFYGLHTNLVPSTFTGANNTSFGYNSCGKMQTGNNNTGFGKNALAQCTNGWQNVAMGVNALGSAVLATNCIAIGVSTLATMVSETTAIIAIGSGALGNVASVDSYSIAIGLSALALNESGLNLAIGAEAGYYCTTGTHSVIIGHHAMRINDAGNQNVVIGYQSLTNSADSSRVVAIGYHALTLATSGDDCIAIGASAMAAVAIPQNNIVIGSGAMSTTTSPGNANTVIGFNTCANNTFTGSYNTTLGYLALLTATAADFNIAIGPNALRLTTTGSSNTAIGPGCMEANTIGSYNTALGRNALSANTEGILNIAIGQDALNGNTVGTNNIAIGISAGSSGTGAGFSYNTIIGIMAGFTVTQAGLVLIGYEAGYGAAAAQHLTAIGYRACHGIIGNGCTAVGYNVLSSTNNISAANNSVFGSEALNSLTTGSGNTAVGTSSGSTVISGTNNTFLGVNAGCDDDNSGCVSIGANATASTSNVLNITLGNGNYFETPITTTDTAPVGAITYLNITINGVLYRILLRQP